MEGEVQMNELLKKDITMKAISVLIAVILWFMVLDQSNPMEYKPLNVPINVLNQDSLGDKSIILKNKNTFPQSVTITLHGRHDKLSDINESDFVANLDLAKINDASLKSLRIDAAYFKNGNSTTKFTKDVTFSYYPTDVNLVLDSVGKNVYQVDVNASGNLKTSYKIINIDTVPDNIQLQGSDTLLKTVKSIKAIIDVTGLDKDLETKINCSIFDKNNKDITKSFAPISVNIKVNVAKEVDVKPIIAGTPAPNFLNTSNIPSPQKVLISGPYNIISKINQILTAPISIENQFQNAIYTSMLVLPDGVTLVNTPQEVTVSLGIEPLSKKTFVISMKDINVLNPQIDNSLNYDLVSPEISIDIKGPKYELDKLSLSNISPSIDVDKLTEGNAKVPLKFVLPPTVRLAQDYEADLLITKR